MRPAFLVGLGFEAAILKGAGGSPSPLMAIARQGDATATRARLEELIAQGADAIVSFGIAGAIDPALTPGTLVLPEAVIDQADGAVFATDPDWRQAMAGRSEGIGGAMLTLFEAVTTPAAKARLFNDTGAVAVDMESAIAGRLAAERGLPFLVVRAIADDAGQSLPAAALAGVDAEGAVKPWATVAALMRRPGDIGALIRLGRATGAAKVTLLRVAQALWPGPEDGPHQAPIVITAVVACIHNHQVRKSLQRKRHGPRDQVPG